MDKINIVINNYFSHDIPPPEEISIKEAYKRGFISGFNKVKPPTPIIHEMKLPDPIIHAKWILSSFQNEEDNMNDNYEYECSNCGAGDVHAKSTHVPYCWHCGVKMEN